MNKIKLFYKGNCIYMLFSYLFTFFLLCSYIFGVGQGFGTFSQLLLVLFLALLITPVTSFLFIKLGQISLPTAKSDRKSKHPIIDYMYNHTLFYGLAIFLMQLPVFLAFYPGMVYYDIGVQIDQYEAADFIANHPLIHTLFMGFFKNLFENPNTGYAIAVLIQMVIVNLSMGYALRYLYQKTGNVVLCSVSMLFYGLFPVNSILTISTTKDILFGAFVLVFFIDTLRFLQGEPVSRLSWARFVLNAVLMLLLRNNAIYAFTPAFCIILIFQFKHKEKFKITLFFVLLTLLLFKGTDKLLMASTEASTSSIKEMMSIPAQEMVRIYATTDDEEDKKIILSYIPEPENYIFYLSDRIKQQLPFDGFNSKCKHFLLDCAIMNLKYPITCLDAILYNTQGFWDLFHMPYQSDHFFLASREYRGDAVLDSKLPALTEAYTSTFYVTENYQNNFITDLFFNSGLYVWIFLFGFANAIAKSISKGNTNSIQKKNRQLAFSCLFVFLYLLTLLLGPGAIIRYTFPFILLAPVMLETILFPNPVTD